MYFLLFIRQLIQRRKLLFGEFLENQENYIHINTLSLK